AIALVGAARDDRLAAAPWGRLQAAPEAAGESATEEARAAAATLAEEAGEVEGSATARRRAREGEESARRAGRRARTEVLDLGLALVAAWLRDLAATAGGGGELALNADRGAALAEQAAGLDPVAARLGAEEAMEARRRLRVNVSEELALEALAFRLGDLLGD
ncbi:MAG TPA: hypothetical protein VK919_10960, partial [Solirubrobacterales bacterium]|nr:hypothetical protein [Solirubrobacterales bacterium]